MNMFEDKNLGFQTIFSILFSAFPSVRLYALVRIEKKSSVDFKRGADKSSLSEFLLFFSNTDWLCKFGIFMLTLMSGHGRSKHIRSPVLPI